LFWWEATKQVEQPRISLLLRPPRCFLLTCDPPPFAFFCHAFLLLQEALEEVKQKEAENKAGEGSFGNHLERKAEQWDNKEEAVFGQLVRVKGCPSHPSLCRTNLENAQSCLRRGHFILQS
jgi:hypothetical protein